MIQEPQEKWQKALGYWDKWAESVEHTKALIKEKYGDLTQLIPHAKTIWPDMEMNNSALLLKYWE